VKPIQELDPAALTRGARISLPLVTGFDSRYGSFMSTVLEIEEAASKTRCHKWQDHLGSLFLLPQPHYLKGRTANPSENTLAGKKWISNDLTTVRNAVLTESWKAGKLAI
jgi:hypothetical protein